MARIRWRCDGSVQGCPVKESGKFCLMDMEQTTDIKYYANSIKRNCLWVYNESHEYPLWYMLKEERAVLPERINPAGYIMEEGDVLLVKLNEARWGIAAIEAVITRATERLHGKWVFLLSVGDSARESETGVWISVTEDNVQFDRPMYLIGRNVRASDFSLMNVDAWLKENKFILTDSGLAYADESKEIDLDIKRKPVRIVKRRRR